MHGPFPAAHDVGDGAPRPAPDVAVGSTGLTGIPAGHDHLDRAPHADEVGREPLQSLRHPLEDAQWLGVVVVVADVDDDIEPGPGTRHDRTVESVEQRRDVLLEVRPLATGTQADPRSVPLRDDVLGERPRPGSSRARSTSPEWLSQETTCPTGASRSGRRWFRFSCVVDDVTRWRPDYFQPCMTCSIHHCGGPREHVHVPVVAPPGDPSVADLVYRGNVERHRLSRGPLPVLDVLGHDRVVARQQVEAFIMEARQLGKRQRQASGDLGRSAGDVVLRCLDVGVLAARVERETSDASPGGTGPPRTLRSACDSPGHWPRGVSCLGPGADPKWPA